MKYFKKFTSFVIIFTIIFSSFVHNASAYNIKKEPFVFVTFKQTLKDSFKVKPNKIYVEKIEGIIDKKNGEGHILGYPEFEMDYSGFKYKNKPLPVKTKMKSYFFSDPLEKNLSESIDYFIARYDFARVKVKTKVKTKKKKYKYVYKYKWVCIYCNGFGYNDGLFCW